ncbi:MAG: type II secretion system protein GspC [Gammaproteobacteria bacterium]|nr:type II secretion system protein GspC [Gammaproteobacteria bacterium]
MLAFTQPNDKIIWLTNKLPRLANIVLTMLIGVSLAALTWQVLAPPPAPGLADHLPSKPSHARQSRSNKPKYATQIANLHLLGRASKPQVQDIPDAPKTRLNLNLRGVLASDDENAMAIIASGGANERFYHLGDAIPGGATLKAVYPDRVLLERNAQMETLPLPKSENTGIEIAKTQPPAVATNIEASNKLSTLRRQILKNPGQLGKLVRAKPVMDQGRFTGYALSPTGNKELFRELGLESGDVVTAVNGITIDRPEKGLNALQKLVSASEVTITLLRGGSEFTLHHNLAP